jgi:hypothetical protein
MLLAVYHRLRAELAAARAKATRKACLPLLTTANTHTTQYHRATGTDTQPHAGTSPLPRVKSLVRQPFPLSDPIPTLLAHERACLDVKRVDSAHRIGSMLASTQHTLPPLSSTLNLPDLSIPSPSIARNPPHLSLAS